MRSSLPIVGLGSMLAIAACGDDNVELHTARIQPLRQPCVGVTNQMCLSAIDLDDESQAQSLLYFGIDGYQHKWGETAEVAFSIEPIAEPLEDGPSSRHVAQHVEVVERARAGDRFSLLFPDFGGGGDNAWFEPDADSNAIVMVDGTEVTCDPMSPCGELFGNGGFVVEFEFDYGGGLYIVDVVPATR
jgi:hypothetical protein